MKNTKKTTLTKRIALFMAIFCVAIALLTPFASAVEPSELFKVWTMTEDEKIIYGDGEPYYLIEDKNFYATESYGYTFYNGIEGKDGYEYSVNSTDENGNYIWTETDKLKFYATDEGRMTFDELERFEGISEYRMYSMSAYSEYAIISAEDAEHIRSNVQKKNRTEIDFSVLGFRTKYDLTAVSSDGALEYVYATVYYVNSCWYYLDRTTLSESCYLEGTNELNYNEGVATVYKLDIKSENAIENAKENVKSVYEYDSYIDGNWIYESDMYYERFIEENRLAVSVIVLLLASVVALFTAFVLPLPVYALGLILPQIKKLGKPKYWYSLCVFAAAWTLLALLFFLVVILVVLI